MYLCCVKVVPDVFITHHWRRPRANRICDRIFKAVWLNRVLSHRAGFLDVRSYNCGSLSYRETLSWPNLLQGRSGSQIWITIFWTNWDKPSSGDELFATMQTFWQLLNKVCIIVPGKSVTDSGASTKSRIYAGDLWSPAESIMWSRFSSSSMISMCASALVSSPSRNQRKSLTLDLLFSEKWMEHMWW